MWYTQPLSAKEILDELEISKDDNYRAFSILKDEDLELHLQLHLKREPNSRLVNNYFDIGLEALQAIMDLQNVFKKNKSVAYTVFSLISANGTY